MFQQGTGPACCLFCCVCCRSHQHHALGTKLQDFQWVNCNCHWHDKISNNNKQQCPLCYTQCVTKSETLTNHVRWKVACCWIKILITFVHYPHPLLPEFRVTVVLQCWQGQTCVWTFTLLVEDEARERRHLSLTVTLGHFSQKIWGIDPLGLAYTPFLR